MRNSAKQKQRLVDTFIERNFPELLLGQLKEDYNRLFYCNWLPEKTARERKYKQKIQKQHPKCCFNHAVGEPTIKFADEAAESDPVPLMGYNRRILNNYLQHRKCSENKCRGSGTTEIVTVRYMIFKYAILNSIPNHKCIIIPGTSGSLSAQLSTRIKTICDKIPDVYSVIPASSTPKEFVFKTGGRILLTNASPDAIRGFENIGDVIMEEVAHWDLEDDTPVYQATQFVHQKTKCHVFHSTTPYGKRGFYYDKVWDPDANTSFFRHVINWREVAGIPVKDVEELYPDVIYENYGVNGIDSMEDVEKIRESCVTKYKKDTQYRQWFDGFFGGLTMGEITDVPILILDVNEIIAESLEDRESYDQELDNIFTASDRRAIGEFPTADYTPLDLERQLQMIAEAHADMEEEIEDEIGDDFDPGKFE